MKHGPGRFLVLDGVDGAGKSTQVRLLADWLSTQGCSVALCHDPGGTPAGDRIRSLLLDSRAQIGMRCETLLYLAARAELVAEIIRPALAAGKLVLSDRYLLSTIVYQGHAGGLPPELVRDLGTLAADGVLPDWTGVLDLSVEAASQRRRSPADRIEGRSIEYHAKVRDGFLAEARRDPERISIIDAAGAPLEVHERIVSEVCRVLEATGRP